MCNDLPAEFFSPKNGWRLSAFTDAQPINLFIFFIKINWVAGYVDFLIIEASQSWDYVEKSIVRILVVVANRLVRIQSTEVRKGFVRIAISHELVGFKH